MEFKRPVSAGAEQWLGVRQRVLDHGEIVLVDYMGNDLAVEEAARVSYGQGTRKVSETTALIRYLLRHRHTSPFEMVEVRFRCALPIFVARQWIRHRTANVNEYSARYSVVPDVYYIPAREVIALQSASNKQGRGDVAGEELAAMTERYVAMDAKQAFAHYDELLDSGLARELARINLPVGTYTYWVWKVDLHNLMHFLGLRLDEHAQYEIRQYAEAMARVVKDAFPISWEAFNDYQLHAVTFSRPELDILRGVLPSVTLESLAPLIILAELQNALERREFLEKLHKLGLIAPVSDAFGYVHELRLEGKKLDDELAFLRSAGICPPA